MPMWRNDGPVRGSSLDGEAEWVSVLAILEELSLGEQLQLLLRFGEWVRECRDTRLELLEFHRETVHRAMALEVGRDWRVLDVQEGPARVIE